jgi:hypothetical protein
MRYKGISWDNELFAREDDPENGGDTIRSEGFHTQAGYFILREKLEIATRFSMVDPDTDISSDLKKEYSGGVNYYFLKHRSKIQTDFSHIITDKGGEGEMRDNIFSTQYQIVF